MCGIAGIYSLDGRPFSPDALASMTAAVTHRGPDDTGEFVGNRIGLGSRRLSILDPSPRGRMPMHDAETGNWIVHNGEVYNYKEIAEELGLGRLRTGTDTEVLLKAFAKEGTDCLSRLNGIYSFAIWDAKAGRLVCVRDRLGVKPLFYAQHEGRLYFASEIKSLLAAGLPAVPDLQTLHDYLVAGIYDHGERTFFDGIRQVNPGHLLIASAETFVTRPYWSITPDIESPADAAWDPKAYKAVCAAYRDLALDAIRLQLRSDVPIAVHTSGGLDSTFLMAALNRIAGGQCNIRAFSYVFDEPAYDERRHVDAVARELDWQVDYRTLTAEKVPALAEHALWHQEQPYPGIVTLAKDNLIRETQEAGAKVILEGQGGDEIGAGYQYHMGPHILDLVAQGRPDTAIAEVRAFAKRNGLSEEAAFCKVLHSQAAYYRSGWSADGTKFLKLGCLNAEFVQATAPDKTFERPFRSHLLNMQYRDIFHTKLPRILRSCDRASMAYGRELRVPFLDHRLVEFSFSIPSVYKIRDGAQRTFMRDALTAILPPSLTGVPKRPVVDPQRDWLRTKLKEWVEGFLNSHSFAQRNLFDAAQVRREFDRYTGDGNPENSFHIWQWLSVEQWFRTFIDTSVRQNS